MQDMPIILILPKCNKPMANMEAQKRHLKRHCRLVFNCTKCDTVCLSKEELLVHKRTHYVEATCTLCNKSFANEESLKVHNTKNHQQVSSRCRKPSKVAIWVHFISIYRHFHSFRPNRGLEVFKI